MAGLTLEDLNTMDSGLASRLGSMGLYFDDNGNGQFNTGTDIMGRINNYAAPVTAGLSALGGLANSYLGYKNYGLAKDQFKFSKQLANTNLANQANLINQDILNRAKVTNSLAGNSISEDEKQARLKRAENSYVSGTLG